MLLDDVENALDLDVNVITREIKKTKLCELNYSINIGKIGINYYKNHPYLFSKTSIFVNRKPFTTSSKHVLYGTQPLLVKNSPLKIKCNGKETKIGFINQFFYLHLPDFVATQLLKIGGNVIAVESKHILDFFKNDLIISSHDYEIASPYYLLNYEFEYNKKANDLAEIIGVFDVYKRGLINQISQDSLKYFLYPYVSLVIYKVTHTTLYPSIIKTLVNHVLNKVRSKAIEVLEEYSEDTIDKLYNKIDKFGSSLILY